MEEMKENVLTELYDSPPGNAVILSEEIFNEYARVERLKQEQMNREIAEILNEYADKSA